MAEFKDIQKALLAVAIKGDPALAKQVEGLAGGGLGDVLKDAANVDDFILRPDGEALKFNKGDLLIGVLS